MMDIIDDPVSIVYDWCMTASVCSFSQPFAELPLSSNTAAVCDLGGGVLTSVSVSDPVSPASACQGDHELSGVSIEQGPQSACKHSLAGRGEF